MGERKDIPLHKAVFAWEQNDMSLGQVFVGERKDIPLGKQVLAGERKEKEITLGRAVFDKAKTPASDS